LALFAKNDVERAATVVVLAAISVALTDSLATFAIKPLVHRLRPCNPQVLIAGGRFLLGHKSSLSFPSNHAMNVFGLATLFSLLYPRFTVWLAFFAGLIGLSRIYVGVHYPLDVWGGALLGATIGVMVYFARPQVETVVARLRPARRRLSPDSRRA
jgi:undecaprenyl-diphosphatase